MKKVGIMGGTFNPPHIGHQIMAQYAQEQLALDTVLFLPTGTVPHKDNAVIIDPWKRYEMVRLMIAGNPRFAVCDLETRLDGIGYTADTVEKLQRQMPETKLFFIVGADSLDYMDRWYQPQRIFDRCTVCVANRMGFAEDGILKKARELEASYGAEIIPVQMPVIAVSSTELRQRIQEGRSIRYLTDNRVEEYIKEKRLYCDSAQNFGGASR